ncbi:PREDICTED: protein PHLOEM PROTEIN 2-LIKE A6-like [Tarenaya hassleriana]|uniref:protein PHLOEM PROTEIN 2-LIKE A6-like n=1 Tax=Tarenaya hassleriana TaxID=28532 RepID=UPI00053C896A|nr:PREDICTED: protein PHLOEM PROTEIN 2-LIKE A6-like [Tarenaya hassleriana]
MRIKEPYKQKTSDSDMAASSSSSAVPQHKVFINFRGEEVRNNFVAHLDRMLKSAGINAFIDRDDGVGKDINDLFKRIEESRVALVVFSSRYTTSKWCLDELVKIKERVDQGGLVVIPIFYKVEPYTVKKLEGEFGEQFWKLVRNHSDKVQRWKEALESISGKRGLTYDGRSNELEFIDSITKSVEEMLHGIRDEASVVICARDLSIEWSHDEKRWKWLPVEETRPNDAAIEVAKLIEVYWLDIRGKIRMKDLKRGTTYEVVFVVKIQDPAEGWHVPVNVKLALPTGEISEREVNLRTQTRGQWLEIPAGAFVTSPDNDGDGYVEFSMYEHNTTDTPKKGLFVKGVAIRTKSH